VVLVVRMLPQGRRGSSVTCHRPSSSVGGGRFLRHLWRASDICHRKRNTIDRRLIGNFGNFAATSRGEIPVAPTHEWTGSDATALRKALHMTETRFASTLGVSPRAVGHWASHPTAVPRVQDRLDELLASSTPAVKIRFEELTANGKAAPTGSAQALRVAIAVVQRADQVLLVRRRNESTGLSWQFCAGIVKPGEHAEEVAVRETLNETGVHCSVVEHIGGRLHPITGVLCDYFRCIYLAGDATNRDNVENAAVTWAPAREVSKFMNRDTIYAPVLAIMEEQGAVR
jgi:8-oxo-dGTP diphosphatase